MSKLPNATREGLSAEQQNIWDYIFAGRTGGGGPYSMLMHSPAMAEHFAATEDYFRNHSLLPDPDREVIILTAAREVEAHYAWSRHEIRAHKVGIQPQTIEALRARAPLDKFAGREKLLVEFTRTLMHDHVLSDELFARMENEFGPAKFIEAVGLLGHYITIGTVIRMFDVRPPEGSKTF
ncbi:MAG: carboxymuconolactone decarboxylase family protein [Deltaproteobacteria bacterium]|nr:carboxymuconolactone decarboxylase family protein [Deltaproteobacteria bacterium]